MKHKGTLLIFAYECYPYNRSGSAIGAQRPYQFAKNLSVVGWKVIVLCCASDKRRTLDGRESELVIKQLYEANRQALDNDDCCIIPLPSLTSHGWADYLWSISVTKGPGDTYIGKGFPYSWIRKFATLYNQLVHGDYSWAWTPSAKAFTEHLLKEHKVDVIIGEHSPDAGILLADYFSRKHNIPWIADFRDPVLWPFKGLFSMLYKQVVKRVVKSAKATINVNPYWSTLDRQLFNKPAHTLVNGYDKVLFDQIQAHSFPFFTVSYFGSFHEEFQDIRPSLEMFSAFLTRHGNPSNVRLLYRGLQQQAFIKYCSAAGIPLHYLDVEAFVNREEAVALMKGSAVLLVYAIPPYKANDKYKIKGFYPGKIFEYIGAAKPVLCIPSDHGLLETLIHDLKIGKATSSLDEAMVFLEHQFEAWKEQKVSNVSFAEHTEKYTRQNQAAQLDVILMKVINTALFR